MSLFANRRKNTDFVADKYGYANPIYYSRTANPYFNPYDSNGNYAYDYDISNKDIPDPLRGFNIFEERANTNKETITTAINAIFNTDLRFNEPIHSPCVIYDMKADTTMEQNIAFPKVACTKLQAPQHHRLRGNCKENGVKVSQIYMKCKLWVVLKYEKTGITH